MLVEDKTYLLLTFFPALTVLSLFKAHHKVAIIHLMLFFVSQRLQVFSTQKIPFCPHFLSQMLRQDSPASLKAFSRCCMGVKLTLSRSGMASISHELLFQVRKFSEIKVFTLVFYSLVIVIATPDQGSSRKSNEDKILGLFKKTVKALNFSRFYILISNVRD